MVMCALFLSGDLSHCVIYVNPLSFQVIKSNLQVVRFSFLAHTTLLISVLSDGARQRAGWQQGEITPMSPCKGHRIQNRMTVYWQFIPVNHKFTQEQVCIILLKLDHLDSLSTLLKGVRLVTVF